MKTRTHWAALAALVALLLAARPAASGEAQGGPQDMIRRSTDRALAIVMDPALKGPEKREERRQKIRAVVDEGFNWDDMARSALGRHWRARTPEERKVFVPLFADLLRNTYMSKIEGYTGNKVLYKGERVEGSYARVSVEIITTKGTAVPVVYSVKQFDGKWLVYDLAIEGVKLVNNYRRQFDSILDRGSFAQLIEKLKAKVASIKDE